ncbi:hypothetical protein [Methylotenera sp.]|uniref:hypothetical protein n=1 Tax=Methylotenera sp. TaxID=2051956 RepID=UPI002733CDD7|nr:hypothetical protein [Methylotenera sp.]MDP3212319.1 hypothetical protein [Methylotenera sp.]
MTLIDRDSDILTRHIDALRRSVEWVKQKHPFDIVAWVVWPDHLHAVWTMPTGDCDYANRWRAIKSNFVRSLKRQGVSIRMRTDGPHCYGNVDFGNTPLKMKRIYVVVFIIVILTP